MRLRSSLSCTFGLFLALGVTAYAQEGEPATFKGGVAEVRLDVQVRQGKKLIGDLAREDFTIRDERQPQAVKYFNRETEPLTLLLVLDVSGSMRRYIQEMSKSAAMALGALRKDDRVGILVYARRPRLHFDFSSSPEEAAARIRTAPDNDYVGSGTNTNDAVVAAAKMLKDKAPAGRRAILIVTDNGGLNEKLPDEEVLKALYDADVVLNSIVVGKGSKPKPMRPDQNPDYTPTDVFRLSEESGGEVLKSEKAAESFVSMVERIRTRYALAYPAPAAAEGQFRQVEVALSAGALRKYPGAKVIARRGYYVR